MATAGIAYLDGQRLARGLLAGIARVAADAEHLNRINVFPVPDGDTGTNLAVMLGSVRAALLRHQERHAGKLLEIVADAALDGARGNSGAILAQFFHGVCDASQDQRLLTTRHFAAAVELGASYAQDALSEPREGTILTVVRDFAAELGQQIAAGGQDFAALLDAGLARAQRSLAATTQQLEALRKAGVVDAGAQGFVDLLQGITDFVRHGSLRTDSENAAPAQGQAHQAQEASFFDAGDNSGHRWCTECLVTGDLDRRRLRGALAGLGSSLVIAGGTRRARIHIHADDPEEVFRAAARFGAVSAKKADDMQAQQVAARSGAGIVAVVTDSAADLPEELLTSMDIHTVPVRIHFGAQSYLDKVSLDTSEFYRLMAESDAHPTTSQPPPGDFRRLYQILASHHAGIVSIHVTGWGSGTFQAAQSAAARAATRTPVLAVDSRNASIGQGLVALRAAELAAAGHSVEEITLALEGIVANTRTWALLGSLEHAVRGGRVPPSKRVIARLLRLEPILATFPDGRIGTAGALLGHRRRIARFARWIAKHAGPPVGQRLAVGHANAPEAAAELLAELQARLPGLEQAFVTEIGTALGVHGGPGTLVVALQRLDT
ncbi:DegV family protein [Thioalkalivibrio sp. XN279]|uniref:DegV family protein n=1 Tax=Thioalkalivibrio sp. XN279 TaxID=2714953 RepID=UPI001407490E|nr:DegV family protein [Thioalkalivibrio sp. XN279]NHA13829.1 DegV family EDD domain-containing protein [Thioalkalivibrio sp. XN279]